MRNPTINPRLVLTVIPAILAGVLMIAPAVATARADDEESGSTYARVRYVEGRLSVQRTEEGEVLEATLNSPIAPGDRVRALDGRAEIELADGSVIWLEEGARLDLRTLADIDNRYERNNVLALDEGSIRINAAEPEEKDKVFRIDTEAGSVYLLSGGSFRIDAGGDLATVSSSRGVAEVSGDAGSELVRTGERTSVRGGRAPSDPRPFNTLRMDDFDRFCEDRLAVYLRHDEDEESEEAEENLPGEVRPYYRELSIYGGWRHLPTYGWVWRPAYYGSWGPYVNGHWTWCPTGWVWVSYDVWGWAPYRYGRWDFVFDVGWVWIPGRVWSGAWVSFAVGSSYIGWCPLNYYNLPVFHDVRLINVVDIRVNRLNPRGWRFAPVGRFADRNLGRVAVRADRLPRGTDLVVSGRLPRFNPRELAERPDRGRGFVEKVRAGRTPLPGIAAAADRPMPFSDFERGAARRPSQDTVTRGRPRHGQAAPRTNHQSPRRRGPARPEGGDRSEPRERTAP
ncbi:MAG: FecR domain-containing protein, partial [Acidobacteria bacterium]|nr:FecR domain-containing protein [Acidobacteriota bacterium]